MEEKLKIFFCEDDENLGMLLREYLQAKGYVTDLFSDGEAGYKGFTKGKYDLCVLDVMMPKKDGFTLAQEIRALNPDIPVIFLTAKTMKEDILEGFKIGADDYLTKPFGVAELLARVRAQRRRQTAGIAPGAVIGWDMGAALALAEALGLNPLIAAELLANAGWTDTAATA